VTKIDYRHSSRGAVHPPGLGDHHGLPQRPRAALGGAAAYRRRHARPDRRRLRVGLVVVPARVVVVGDEGGVLVARAAVVFVVRPRLPGLHGD
jgi:hypothetical protein